MKKLISLLLTAALLVVSIFAMASCQPEEEPVEKLTCGVTIFEKMNEQLPDGTWTGFETEFAQAVAKELGMEAEFVEINWEQKYNEVNSGAIDCIWNGFTANSSDNGTPRKDLVDFSYGYMLNQQCIVVKTDRLAEFTSAEALAGKKASVEGGSAGQAYADSVNASEVVKAPAQINTFTEVSSGAVDFAVVDVVLAENICGQGQFTNLSIVEAIELESEIYAIGFKKGSDLTAKVNAAIKTLEENGTLAALAEKYGFENVVKVQETIE